MARTSDRASRTEADAGPLNEVHLRGRVSGLPETRALPSGDTVVLVRLVVPRTRAGARHRPDGRTGRLVSTPSTARSGAATSAVASPPGATATRSRSSARCIGGSGAREPASPAATRSRP